MTSISSFFTGVLTITAGYVIGKNGVIANISIIANAIKNYAIMQVWSSEGLTAYSLGLIIGAILACMLYGIIAILYCMFGGVKTTVSVAPYIPRKEVENGVEVLFKDGSKKSFEFKRV